MIEANIPDFGWLRLAHLVLDYNGALAFDGRLISGVADFLELLAKHLRIHIITADTFGTAYTQPLPAPPLRSMSCLRAVRRKAKPIICGLSADVNVGSYMFYVFRLISRQGPQSECSMPPFLLENMSRKQDIVKN
jgi:hypothetical protein